MPDSPSKEIREKVLDWAAPCFPLEVREEAVRAYNDFVEGRTSEVLDYYVSELKFGTGGLRGVIGNGPGRMNQWTVGKATVGFCDFLIHNFKKPSIVIAHDSRRMSREFAKITAGIAASKGLRAFLFDDVAPTPVLSYAVRHLKASGGVVITASHNPPEYNGYKVYWDDGSQMVGPVQDELEGCIEKVRDWSKIPFLADTENLFKDRVKSIGEDIKKAYYAEYEKCAYVSAATRPEKSKIQIVYSPLHGTGGGWLPGLLKKSGFHVQLVEEQAKPDGEFPTVKYPNPEEAEALKLSQEKAKSIGADLFLATDPDADRLGAGVRNASGGYTLITGNQIGSIMCAYLCERTAQEKSKKHRYHVFKTIVTSDLQREIARAHNVGIADVLTGFKYIAEQMRELEKGSKHWGYEKGRDVFLFGGEESYGYLPVPFVRDKDSLASALLLCEIRAEVGDLLAYMDQIYLRYGLFLEDLKSATLKGSGGQAKIKEIMEKLRSTDLSGWTLGARKVVSVLDYKNLTRDHKPSPADFKYTPKSDVIQLILEPEGKLTIRPSGTEPKVKLYASLRAGQQPGSPEELVMRKGELENELASISGLFFARAGLAG